jgi:nitrate/nitrite transporter NarK
LQNEQGLEVTLIQGIKELFYNRNFIYLFLCFNFIYGSYSAIASVLSSMTEPYGYNPQENSIVALVFMLSGIFNSFFLGTILDKY